MSTKAPHRKSRNGCLRCKARRVKCDQKNPACSRCVDRGLQCPGYSLNIRWDPRSQLQAPTSSATDKTKESLIPSRESWSGSNFSQLSIGQANEPLSAMDSWIAEPTSSINWSSILDATQSSIWCDDDFPPPTPLIPLSFPAVAGEEASISNPLTMPFSPILTNPFMDLSQHYQPDQLPSEYQSEHAIEDSSAVMNTMERWNPIPLSNLHTQYSSSPTSRGMMAVTHVPEITHLPTFLSEYFFKDVIKLYSVWDNHSNQLRILAGSFWQSSGVLYHTMQSMAAALLSKSSPNLHAVAVTERQLGFECLRNGNDTDKDRLIGAILLGHTSSWVRPHELAHENFEKSLMILHAWASKTRDHSLLSFFGGAVDYWAMLLSFVSEPRTNQDFLRHSVVEAGPARADDLIDPHPFIGTSGSIVQVLTELGTLIFRHRKRVSQIEFISEEDLDFFRKSIQRARQLERRLLSFKPLLPRSVQDPGDQTTPPIHFVKIDEGLRCTGLLQLYRVFPDLLNDRYQPWDPAVLLQPHPALKTPSQEERNTWLTLLALHILDINREIPFESRTRCMQPFMFVATSCELRTPVDLGMEAEGNNLSYSANHITQARFFVRSRMSAYLQVFPLQKVEKMFQLIQSIWSSIDSGQEVFWLDVCNRLKLGTLMG